MSDAKRENKKEEEKKEVTVSEKILMFMIQDLRLEIQTLKNENLMLQNRINNLMNQQGMKGHGTR